MQREVIVLQHADREGPGLLGELLAEQGVALRVLRPDQGEAVPASLGEAAGLVILGGAMGVNETETFPFLRDEMRLISSAVEAGRAVLGICLGSQLIAAALGAEVSPNFAQEIGWIQVALRPEGREDPVLQPLPQRFIPLQWHGDIFSLPNGAVSLARSAVSEHQAFRVGSRVYGLLFHLEMTPELLRDMVQSDLDALAAEGVDGQMMLSRADELCAVLRPAAREVFRRWIALLQVD
jgi:GMP synthase (glutamine-hydrolysing)